MTKLSCLAGDPTNDSWMNLCITYSFALSQLDAEGVSLILDTYLAVLVLSQLDVEGVSLILDTYLAVLVLSQLDAEGVSLILDTSQLLSQLLQLLLPLPVDSQFLAYLLGINKNPVTLSFSILFALDYDKISNAETPLKMFKIIVAT